MGGFYCLEQGTGIEPAFTAWEAVVLPIYEPCVAHSIANSFGEFKGLLFVGLVGWFGLVAFPIQVI